MQISGVQNIIKMKLSGKIFANVEYFLYLCSGLLYA